MKKLGLFSVLLMMALVFSACSGVTMLSDNDADIYAKIYKRYMKMTSYMADVKITVVGNKTENEYLAKQVCICPDKMMLEFENGMKKVFSGDKARLTYEGNLREFQSDDDINYLFINEFFELYYRSQDTAISVSNHESGGSTFLETELTHKTSHRYKAVLKINNQTLNPERLSVCDIKGTEVLYADFSSFLYNPKINDDFLCNNGGFFL